jgi:hypothetical protein
MKVSKMLADTDPSVWRAYLRFHTVDSASPYLADAFVQENYEFYGKTLNGQKEQKPRWKRVLGTIENDAGEAFGQLYEGRLLAGSQGEDGRTGEEPGRLAEGPHPGPELDERRNQGQGHRQVGNLHPEDRLPGQVA